MKNQKGFNALVLVLVIVLVAGAALFFIFRTNGPADVVEQDLQKPSGDGQMQEEDKSNGEFSLPPATNFPGDSEGEVYRPEDNVVLETVLNSQDTQVALLGDVDGSGSSGTAYRLTKDGTLYHAVVATMAPPKEGYSYEGWLVQSSPLKFFSTGVMRSPEAGVWVLEYERDGEYSSYNKVVITEEKTIDATPERHVIEGNF